MNWLSTTLQALAVAACASTAPADHMLRAWSVDIAPIGDRESAGFGTVSELSTGVTRVLVTVAGLAAAERYSWRLLAGTCDVPGKPIAASDGYGALRPSPGGTASASATLSSRLEPDGEYAIRLLASDVSAACGELRAIEG